MQSRIPPSNIQHFLATNTRPLTPRPSSPCPICRKQYSPRDLSYVHPVHPLTETEYAVQIVGRSECLHIFGRVCLEKHIAGGLPWSHACPICRAEWFPPVRTGRREVLEAIEGAMAMLEGLDGGDVGELVGEEARAVREELGRARDVLYQSRWI